MNPSLSEESSAFSDMIMDTGPIDDAEPIGQIYCIKIEAAGPIAQITSIETEHAGPMEEKYSIAMKDAERIKLKYHLIKTEDDSASVERDHYSDNKEDVSSAEEDVTMKEKSLDLDFQMSEEVCILLITDLFVCYLFCTLTDINPYYYITSMLLQSTSVGST